MASRKKPRLPDSKPSQTEIASASQPTPLPSDSAIDKSLPPTDFSNANGYGMETEDMDWASLAKESWKGKGLADDIKKVEVRMSFLHVFGHVRRAHHVFFNFTP
jgi:hypothetical protein